MFSWLLIASCVAVAFPFPKERMTLPSMCPNECLPCETKQLDCPNGKVKDECGCCEQCLRKIGETCGSGNGICDNELVCISTMGQNGTICQPCKRNVFRMPYSNARKICVMSKTVLELFVKQMLELSRFIVAKITVW